MSNSHTNLEWRVKTSCWGTCFIFTPMIVLRSPKQRTRTQSLYWPINDWYVKTSLSPKEGRMGEESGETQIILSNSMIFLFHFLVGLSLNSSLQVCKSRHSTTWDIPPFHFAVIILEMEVSQPICLGWPWTTILLTSASQVSRITDVRHWHPANSMTLNVNERF
jgi:hypothetical protein